MGRLRPGVTSEMRPDVLVEWELQASADDAWSHLVDLTRMNEWLGKPNRVTEHVIDVDHGDEYTCRSEVVRCDLGERVLDVTWKFPDEPTTRVHVQIESRMRESRLVLRHTGLGALADDYRVGWQTHLTYFAASLMGEPLDMADFWKLHGALKADA